jgi:colicin import membrane protein
MAEETGLMIVSGYTAVQLFAPGVPDQLIEKIEARAREEAKNSDISTESGRKAVASLAYKVARTKTAIDGEGKGLVDGEKKRLAAIDAERKKFRDRLDALRDEVRKPLDEFEAAEIRRVQQHEAAIAAICDLYSFAFTPTGDQIEERLTQARAASVSDMQEFSARAATAQRNAILILEPMLQGARAKEAEAIAEIERQAAEAAKAQKQREEAIAESARQAEARRAEEVAAAAARDAERERLRLQEEGAAREAAIKAEKAAAEERARKAEQDRIEAEVKAKRDAQELAARVERQRIAAEESAKAEKAAAVKAEQDRAELARKKELADAALREADKAHRTRINRAAASAIEAVLWGMNLESARDVAQAVVKAIAKGDVPAVKIAY